MIMYWYSVKFKWAKDEVRKNSQKHAYLTTGTARTTASIAPRPRPVAVAAGRSGLHPPYLTPRVSSTVAA